MAGNRPDVKLSIKACSGGGEPIDIGAWWRKDGKLSGGWDKKIAAVQIRFTDGSTIVIKKGDKFMDHYLNLKDWSDGGGSRRGGGGGSSRRDDDMGDF